MKQEIHQLGGKKKCITGKKRKQEIHQLGGKKKCITREEKRHASAGTKKRKALVGSKKLPCGPVLLG